MSRSSQIGKQIGPYTLCMELASGGMATVFLARATMSAAPVGLVALKVFHRHLAGQQDFVEMFADEARIGALLRHPNLCEVFEFGAADETYYLAMEYLNGEPLSAVFRRTARRTTRLDEHAAMVVRVLADACAGLHAAHTLQGADGKPLNLVHRDVSPENLFVTYGGLTKVVDFGLVNARIQTHRTRTGIIKGKYAYVSPEALRGVKVDRRADVFSLGVVAWELLTGRRLFRRTTDLETLAAVADAPIPAPSSVRFGLPQELDAVVLRALSRDVSQRQRSAAAFAEELLAAYAPAARQTETEIAEWMSELFPDERRWKARVIDLILALSKGNGPAVERESAPGIEAPASRRSRSALSPSRSGLHLFLRRRRSLASAGLLGAAVTAVAMARPPTLAEAEARTDPAQGPFNRSARSTGQAPPLVSGAALGTAAEPRAPARAGSARQSLELPTDGRYVLEIADGPDGNKLLILRVQEEATAGSQPTPVGADAGGTANKPLTAPPVWLRDRLEGERKRRWAEVDDRVRAEAEALSRRGPTSS